MGLDAASEGMILRGQLAVVQAGPPPPERDEGQHQDERHHADERRAVSVKRVSGAAVAASTSCSRVHGRPGTATPTPSCASRPMAVEAYTRTLRPGPARRAAPAPAARLAGHHLLGPAGPTGSGESARRSRPAVQRPAALRAVPPLARSSRAAPRPARRARPRPDTGGTGRTTSSTRRAPGSAVSPASGAHGSKCRRGGGGRDRRCPRELANPAGAAQQPAAGPGRPARRRPAPAARRSRRAAAGNRAAARSPAPAPRPAG